jgi:glycosyltransferase involved in cell wall biosynthesis
MMHDADVFVLPSWHDTFGVVYVEAMACGLPIVATRCGGPDSFITDEIGRLVPVKSPILLAEAIGELIDNLECYSRNTIRRIFEENFSDETVVRRLEAVYDQALMSYTD